MRPTVRLTMDLLGLLALLRRDRRAVTAVEYGLIGMGVFVAVAAAVMGVGTAALRAWLAGANAFPR